MPTNIEIDSLAQILQTLTTSLNEHTGEQELFESSLEEPISFAFMGAKGSLDGEAKIDLFSSKDDIDESGVLFTQAVDAPAFQLSPQIQFTGSHNWLKYSVDASIKGDGSSSLSDLDIGIDGSFELQISAYKRHTPNKKIKDAVAADVVNFPIIWSVDDVTSLKTEDALLLDAFGDLSINAEFKWSDILAPSVSLFSDLLDHGELLDFKLDASATATLAVKINGGFKVVFYKRKGDSGLTRVAVKKSSLFDVSGSLGATISAQLINSDDFKQVYTAVVEGFFATPIDKIDDILALTNTDDIPETLLPYVEEIADRIGLQDAINYLQDIQNKIKALKNKITTAIETAATVKAELSFAYEYNRVSETQSLVELVVNNDHMEQVHKKALSGQVLALTAMVDDSNIKLERFFFQKSTKIEQSYGFDLGFGKWEAMSRDYKTLQEVVTLNSDLSPKIATVGLRGYKDSYFGDGREFFVEFEASMPDYTVYEDPIVDEFDLGLKLLHRREEKKISQSEYIGLVDDLAIWGLVPKKDIKEALTKLKDDLKGATNVRLVKTLMISDEALRAMLPALGTYNIDHFAEALAAALPYVSRLKDGRETVGQRIELYQPIMREFLLGDRWDAYSIATHARNEFKRMGLKTLAREEGRWKEAGGSINKYLGGLVYNTSNMKKDLVNICEGFEELDAAIEHGGSYKELNNVFRLFDDIGESDYFNRVFGYHFLSIATQLHIPPTQVSCTAVFEYKQDGESKQMVWALA